MKERREKLLLRSRTRKGSISSSAKVNEGTHWQSNSMKHLHGYDRTTKSEVEMKVVQGVAKEVEEEEEEMIGSFDDHVQRRKMRKLATASHQYSASEMIGRD